MIRLFSSILMLLLAHSSLALEQDWQQAVTILSDHAELDRKTGMVMYEGNVTLTQGSLRIEAEQLLLFRKGDQLERVTARGTPARYEQIISDGDSLTRAHGKRIDYMAVQREILIEGNARLEQDGNQFSGEQIRYDMLRDIISAQGGESKPGEEGKQRIKVILQPQTSQEPGVTDSSDSPPAADSAKENSATDDTTSNAATTDTDALPSDNATTEDSDENPES